PCATDSGNLITSMARARLGSRRIKPRSSSAVIRRWIPDLERRSSASFISSKEGGTPASLRRSWMKRSNSNCFRVSILYFPHCSGPRRLAETNHEQTLYVRYVFRNHLIWRERAQGTARVCVRGSTCTALIGPKYLSLGQSRPLNESRDHRLSDCCCGWR